MKLLRLEFEGVGSFADRTTIDFQNLSEAGLFLIEGPTGSGKSTILDALVYALYGSVASRDGDAGRLDSHMRTETPYVEADFEVASVVYRVRRSPRHDRRRKRGEGMTNENPTACLIRLSPDGPLELANRVQDVSVQVQDIIGLTKQQFVSTIVLAQGEFAEFLDAKTEIRADILERIFDTGFYSQVEDQLAAMKRQALGQVQAAKAEVSKAVQQCQGWLDAQIDEDDPIPAIDAVVAALNNELATAAKAVEQATGQRAEVQQKHAAATKLIELQDRKRTALKDQEALESRREDVDRCRRELGEHQRATPVLPAVLEWRAAGADVVAAQSAEQQALQQLRELGETQTPGPERLAQLADLLGRLQHPLEVEKGLVEQQKVVRQQQVELSEADTLVEESQSALDQLGADLKEVQQRFESGQDLSGPIAEAKTQLAQAEEQKKTADELLTKTEALENAEADLKRATTALDAAEVALREAEDAVRADHAAALAMRLVDGEACLVCGATEHPQPAQATSGFDQGLLATKREERDRVAQAERAAAVHVRTLAAQVADLREKAPAGDAVTAVESLSMRVKELSGQQEQRLEDQKLLADLTQKQQRLTSALSEARLTQQAKRKDLEATTTAVASAQKTIDQAREGADTVGQRLAEVTAVQMAVQAAADAVKRLADGARAVQSAERVMNETLQSVGFDDPDQAQASILDPERVAAHSAAVDLWDEQRAAVNAALEELEQVDLEQAVDAVGLAEALQQATEHEQQCREAASALEHRIKGADARRAMVTDRLTELDKVVQRTEGVIRMADLATAGRQEVIHKIRLSTFVLMRKFEDVVNAANDRLNSISDGRYQLIVETHGLDKRGQAGLDLKILDHRSERDRSVKSLSGGERFYVSLALALGLADVVRGESGGVELGTLFIDEGFGSLDSEILEEVMDMLEQVRVGEDRVIGLISHVEILKERIDPRISVRRDPRRPGVSTLAVYA